MREDELRDDVEYSIAYEYNQQGQALLGVEKYDEAIEYFKKAEKEDPMLIDTYFNLGNAFAIMENYDEAEEYFKKTLLIDKTNPLSYFNLGNISFIQNDISKGIEYYNKAASYGYEDGEMYHNLGLVYEEMGNYTLAIRNYTKAIAKDPLRPDFRLRKAAIYIATNSYEEALETLEELNELFPDIFEGYHLRFEIYCVQEKYDEAEKIINHAKELFPEDVSILYDKVRLCNIKGEYDKALQMIDDAQEMEDYEYEKRNLVFEKAKIYAQKEDVQATIQLLESMKELEAGEYDYEARYFLMNAYLSSGNYEKVLENAEVLASHGQESQYGRTGIYYKPFSLKMLNRLDEAEKFYKEAKRILRLITIKEPGNIEAYLFRVLCYKDTGDFEKAIELIDYVLNLDDNAEAYLIRSTIYKEQGEMVKAKEDYEKAKKIRPLLDIGEII